VIDHRLVDCVAAFAGLAFPFGLDLFGGFLDVLDGGHR
jgi:hypothetical protein